MSNVVFFSFKERDRDLVGKIKARAVNPNYSNLQFRVRDLLKRWKTTETAVIKRAITEKMTGTSKTIVFVGYRTHNSGWVKHEVEMTIERGKPVYAIFLKDCEDALIPECLSSRGIKVQAWSEQNLQTLATK